MTIWHAYVRYARTDRVEDDEIGVRRPDGSYVWLSTTAAPIPVNGYGVVAAYTDVTERKEAIERDKRQQSEFAELHGSALWAKWHRRWRTNSGSRSVPA